MRLTCLLLLSATLHAATVDIFSVSYDPAITTSISRTNEGLSGAIPTEIGLMTQLTTLDLSDNTLSGAVPTQIGELTALEFLFLNANQLTSLPAEISALTNMGRVELNENAWDRIPTQFGALTQLSRLHLEESNTPGSIPSQLGLLTALTDLRLHNNSLSGEIPPQVMALSDLAFLQLDHNELTGTVPDGLADMDSLFLFYIGNNPLQGSLPAVVGTLPSLAYLDMSNTFLSIETPFDSDFCSYRLACGSTLVSPADCATCSLTLISQTPSPSPSPTPSPSSSLSLSQTISLSQTVSISPTISFTSSSSYSTSESSSSSRSGSTSLSSSTSLSASTSLSSTSSPSSSTSYSTSESPSSTGAPSPSTSPSASPSPSMSTTPSLSAPPSSSVSPPPSPSTSPSTSGPAALSPSPSVSSLPSLSPSPSISGNDTIALAPPESPPPGFGTVEMTITVVAGSVAVMGAAALAFAKKKTRQNSKNAAVAGAIGMGGVAVVQCFPLVGQFVTLVKSLAELYEDMQDTGYFTRQFLRWAHSLTEIIVELDGLLQKEGRSESAVRNILEAAFNDAKELHRVSAKYIEKGQLNKFVGTIAYKRQLDRLRDSVDVALGALQVGLDAHIISQQNRLLDEVLNMKQRSSNKEFHDRSREKHISRAEVDPRFLHFTDKTPFASGGQASVYRAKFQGSEVAVKVVSLQNMPMKQRQKVFERFLDEVSLLYQLRNPNIVNLYGVITVNPEELVMIMDLATHGDLRGFLYTPPAPLTPADRVLLLLDIAYGLMYLHSQDVEHRDIKSMNCLMYPDSASNRIRAKLGDFGISKQRNQGFTSVECTPRGGTSSYRSPESLRDDPTGRPGDIYSFGVLMWEVMTGLVPFNGLSDPKIALAVLSDDKRPSHFAPDAPPLAEDMDILIRDCWSTHPNARPEIGDIVVRLEGVLASLPDSCPSGLVCVSRLPVISSPLEGGASKNGPSSLMATNGLIPEEKRAPQHEVSFLKTLKLWTGRRNDTVNSLESGPLSPDAKSERSRRDGKWRSKNNRSDLSDSTLGADLPRASSWKVRSPATLLRNLSGMSNASGKSVVAEETIPVAHPSPVREGNERLSISTAKETESLSGRLSISTAKEGADSPVKGSPVSERLSGQFDASPSSRWMQQRQDSIKKKRTHSQRLMSLRQAGESDESKGELV